MSYILSRHTSECNDDPEILAGIISTKESKKRQSLKEQQNLSKRNSRNSSSYSIDKNSTTQSPAKIRSRRSSRHSQSRYSSIDGDDNDDLIVDGLPDEDIDTDSDDNETYAIYNKAKAEQVVSMSLIDYFSSQDIDETVEILLPFMNEKCITETLKKIITYPMTNGDYGVYGAISDLIFALVKKMEKSYIDIHGPLQCVIEEVLLSINEWSLDCPKVEDLFAVFLARLTLDDIYQDGHLQGLLGKFSLYDGADSCINKAINIVNKPEKIRQIIPEVTGYEPIENLSQQIFLIIKEYLRANSIEETRKKLVDLQSPLYKHEIVYQCSIISAIENDKTVNALLGELIMKMYDDNELPPRFIKEGLVRFFQNIKNHQLKIGKEEADGFVNVLRQKKELGIDECIKCI
ncbi:Initiation factor eIF-4 gamma, MA3 domain and MIF4-like, type 1/2/3 domain and Armadillo-type fold domain-containing protein [Strongyloides ratti]|uniref:Initiation factor eIF-4 gamma, MA3 domain and MIF4-like, type 1/2/3 domain and Armadillo-type fold domain-containing protein n=1 Tax=Strongyloides ratti TaxID=34506 RepID=A0A090MZN1_STRRB|nr:Initiation factor eIF-4 gamma, MA3 domain and MIF4-like, type 1/2/3 domain and Armadillo-type fold domain-containing protein [Strongyloides ratti]CEF69224.1 Initiation factor eIF-4 gamma, MA3 domain and MIF4-like, type 1/2/3 domain and Armadillo-type fold domain-containing protein [Strongyloides ratti]